MTTLETEPRKKPVPRRRFLNGFLTGTLAALGAAVIYPVIRFVSPPRIAEAATNRVLAGKVSQLAESKWMIFPFGSDPGILIQIASGEYRAFSALCTHLSCTVQYEQDSKRIWCACHNGWYDLNGQVVSGPPPHPLKQYDVNVVGDDIFVTRA
jgi:cytochrome b6-f complex iron-sulfur subunit